MTDDTAIRTFATKVDLWLAALLILPLIGAAAALLRGLRTDPAQALPGAMILGTVVLVVVLLAIPTQYTITETELIIRSGILRYAIPLQGIWRVYPTHNPLSSPAWSLDRLGIQYRKGKVSSLALISPSEREDFLSTLQSRAGLQRVGRELVREPDA